MHNFLTRDGTPPAELLAAGRAEVAAYGGSMLHARVHSAVARDDWFEVVVDGSAARVNPLQARRLLVTTGLTDQLPAVPGLSQRWGRDVLHCPYCHGWEVRDHAVGVLGGPMGVHQALLFSQLTSDVVLFTHTGPLPAADELDLLRARSIRIITGEVSGLVVEQDALSGIQMADGEEVVRQVLVIAPRFSANAEVLGGLGLDTSEMVIADHVVGEYVPSDPTSGATTVPGVYLAGNVTDPMGQVIGAANAGLRAGAAINADLVMAEARQAVQRGDERAEIRR